MRHGSFEKFYPDGKKALSGEYRNGVPHGNFTRWDEQGNIERRSLYDEGELIWTSTDPGEFPLREIADQDRDDGVRVGSARPISATQVVIQLGGGLRIASTAERSEPSKLSPASDWTLDLDAHLRHGWFFIGPTLSYSKSDLKLEERYAGLAVGLWRSLAQQRVTPSLRVEVGGHQFKDVGEDFGIDHETTWRRYVGVGGSLGMSLSRHFELAGALRWRKDLGPDAFMTMGESCGFGGCVTVTEDWTIGGTETVGSFFLRYIAR